ncbi:MAG: RNase adapter RapZ [Pseudomonadota bacterium]|nr:RNase adapter RapZ [Pseudomonadota bacterium]
MKKYKSKLIIVTGLSGSGKSVALHSLEDQGYFCIDNLSPNMIINMLDKIKNPKEKVYEKVAISIDIRSIKLEKDFKESIDLLYRKLNSLNIQTTTLFLHSSIKVLISRFNATRRLHPLTNKKINLKDAILKEISIMQDLKENSDLIIDTDQLLPLDLKRQITSKISFVRDNKDILIQIQSFGYKNNIPDDSDFVFDVRCLKNPFWNEHLRLLSGKDLKVKNFIKKDRLALEMENNIVKFLNKWIPQFLKSDRNYLTVSIGCTGGQHRSVYITEKVSITLRKKYNILVKHRDIK